MGEGREGEGQGEADVEGGRGQWPTVKALKIN